MPIRVLGAIFVCLWSSTAMAQTLDYRWEVFGGLGYIHTDLIIESELRSSADTGIPFGWNAQLSFFVTDDVALVGEADVQYGTQNVGSKQGASATLRSYMGGARFGEHNGRFEFSLHILAGLAIAQSEDVPGADTSDTSPAVTFGGGLAYMFTGRLGIRIFQADAMFSNAVKSTPAFRMATGVLYRW
jgi:hypothetical protein